MPEVLRDAGLMFDPMSVESIAEAIYSVAMDDALRSDLKQRGPSRAAQFSWESAARQTWAVLQELAGKL
jgi:glycosyltransferase involved in cell wall biosynthesis